MSDTGICKSNFMIIINANFLKLLKGIDRRMNVYEGRSDFTTEFDVSLAVEGDPADIDENGVFNWKKILLLESEVNTIDSGDECGENKETILAITFSADEESLILEVASQRDGLEFPFADVVLADPRVETRIEAVQFDGGLISNAVTHSFPTCGNSLVLSIMVEGSISRNSTQRGECNTTSARNSSKSAHVKSVRKEVLK